MNDKRKKGRNDAVPTSRPVLERELQLNTIEANRVFKRTFEFTARNLYAIDVLTSVLLNAQANQKAVETVEEWMSKVRTDLEAERARLDVLYEQLGIKVCARYTNPQRYTAEFSTPLAARYIKLIEQLDAFLIIVHTLYLNDAFEDGQTSVRTYQWQQRVIKLSGRIRALAGGVRREIKNKNIVGADGMPLDENVQKLLQNDVPEDAGAGETPEPENTDATAQDAAIVTPEETVPKKTRKRAAA